MKIKSKIKEYEVIFENDFMFFEELSHIPMAQFVVDNNVYELYQPCFKHIDKEKLLIIEALEKNKTIDTALMICERMTSIPGRRNAVLISAGGGIIQDITGFVANVLYRGIRWIYIPTTLLSQSDSCIGGKTSLNYLSYKNLLGTFYPPDEIYICPDFVNTLSPADFESGMGEVIKFNIMSGKEGIEYISGHMNELLKRDSRAVREAVRRSLEFKRFFIEKDEFDRGERIKLNFAHTFGHAIETVTRYQIPHGTAVAIGMIMADSISVKRGMLTAEFAQKSEKLLLEIIHINSSILGRYTDEFVQAMHKDKKQVGDSLTAVLMADNHGELEIVHDLTTDEVAYAFEYFRKLYLESGDVYRAGDGK